MNKLLAPLSLLMMAAIVMLGGCQTTTTTNEPAPKKSMIGTYDQSSKITKGMEVSNGGMNFSSLGFEAGAGDPVVLEKIMPETVAAGVPFDYMIKVYNTTAHPVYDVTVTEKFPSDLKVESASPAADSVNNGVATWNMEKLDAGETKTITVKASTNKVGMIGSCATVTFVPQVCVTTKVVKPELALKKTMTPDVLLCDVINVTYVVSNPGTGDLTDVMVEDKLPAGLMTLDDSDTISFKVPTLKAGASMPMQYVLKASKTGKFASEATATSGNMSAKADAGVTVTQPKLVISKEGPEMLYLGRNATYTITIKNEGDAPAANLILTDSLDPSSQYIQSSDGGVATPGKVTWNLGTLAVGASKDVTITVQPTAKTKITNTAMAVATCADRVSAQASTEVKGIPAILLEVVDADDNDPAEVGSNVLYTITVTNQGSADGKNITIVAELEDSMEFVSGTGVTTGKLNGSTITFAPLEKLAPGAKASWNVVVKAKKAGDVRFGVKMTEDQLERPVIENEATNFYE